MRKDKKDDESGSQNPFANLDKTAVIQEVGFWVGILET